MNANNVSLEDIEYSRDLVLEIMTEMHEALIKENNTNGFLTKKSFELRKKIEATKYIEHITLEALCEKLFESEDC